MVLQKSNSGRELSYSRALGISRVQIRRLLNLNGIDPLD